MDLAILVRVTDCPVKALVYRLRNKANRILEGYLGVANCALIFNLISLYRADGLLICPVPCVAWPILIIGVPGNRRVVRALGLVVWWRFDRRVLNQDLIRCRRITDRLHGDQVTHHQQWPRAGRGQYPPQPQCLCRINEAVEAHFAKHPAGHIQVAIGQVDAVHRLGARDGRVSARLGDPATGQAGGYYAAQVADVWRRSCCRWLNRCPLGVFIGVVNLSLHQVPRQGQQAANGQGGLVFDWVALGLDHPQAPWEPGQGVARQPNPQ